MGKIVGVVGPEEDRLRGEPAGRGRGQAGADGRYRVRKSGIKQGDVKPHDLRRTFGMWYLQGNPEKFRELADLMGHADLSRLTQYIPSDEKHTRKEVTKL